MKWLPTGKHRRYSVAIIVAVAVILAWSLARSPDDLLYQPSPVLRHEPDYYLEDFEFFLADPDGRPRYHLVAASMSHYPDTNESELEQIALAVKLPMGGSWHITAEQANVDQASDLIELLGAVTLQRMAPAGARELQMTTTNLSIYPEKKYAESAAAVTIQQDMASTEAQGLYIDFDQQRLLLRSNIKSRYDITLP